MDKEIYEILNRIELFNCEAYVVGGFVRDHLSNVKSLDIDIATNAKLEKLKEIFLEYDYKIKNECLYFCRKEYNFEITTYRVDKKYLNHRNNFESKYTNKDIKDSKRRDFTVNALYMNKIGKIRDFNKGLKDFKKKRLKMMGNPNKRLKEDYLRILRAFRFLVTLDFYLDKRLEKYIKKYKNKIKELSFYRKKEELNKMLNKNINRTVDIINEYDLYSELSILKKIDKVNDIYEFWSYTDYEKYPFTKKEKSQIKYYLSIIE